MMEWSKGTWGNKMGFVCVPLDIALHHNPLDYLYSAKATIDRKKKSLEAICTFIANKFITGLFGEKVTASIFFSLAVSSSKLSCQNFDFDFSFNRSPVLS